MAIGTAFVEAETSQKKERHGRWWKWAPLGLAIVVFLSLSLSLAYTKAPWCDEGWFVNPAYDLAFHGKMGSNILEPSGHFLNAYLRGVQERTYIFMPNHLVALAAWFRLFGFSTMSTRAYSAFWSALGLAALFYVFLKLFPDQRIAQFAVVLIAIDFIFLCASADGRPEAITSSLAICSVAAYLRFREGSLDRAIVVSQVFSAAAVFAHPNAFLVVFALGALAIYLDRQRLKPRHIIWASAPYAVFALLWSLYILQNPQDFRAQFFPQAGFGGRWKGVLRPDLAILAEIVRHLAAYYFSCPWSGVMKSWTSAIPYLYPPALLWFVRKRRRLGTTERALLIFAVVLLGGMIFLNGFKEYFYLIYIIPIYDGILAAWLLDLWNQSNKGKWIASVWALTFVGLQLSISIQHIREDEYHRDYQPTVRELLRARAAGKTIVGTAGLGFGLAFQGFLDDSRMGKYSGIHPDVLVVDRSYRFLARNLAETEPDVFKHIIEVLSTQYRFAAQHGSFWIFERVQPAGTVTPWLDVRKVEATQKTQRAAYFFRLIFDTCKMRDLERSTL